jgi:hypothetical protein
VTALETVCQALRIDPEQETPGRAIVRGVGQALAETRDHQNWELIGKRST